MEKTLRMFILMAMVMVMILYSNPVLGQAEQETDQKILFVQAIQARMRVLERHYQVKFDPAWVVSEKLIFGIPESVDASQRKNFGAEYHPDTQCLFFKPAYLDEKIKSQFFEEDILVSGEFRNKFRELFDHELGHVLADHLSRRLGKGAWPNTESFKQVKWEAKQGINIISEGIGSFFEYTSIFESAKISDEFLPEKQEDPRWQDRDQVKKIHYDGGHWLVRPIIKQFGERGIIYLVTHPFVFCDNAREAAHRYQNKAIEKLSQK